MASDGATSYEIIRNFDRAAPWEPNPPKRLRRAAHHGVFLQSYLA